MPLEDKDRILAPSIRLDPNMAALEDVAARLQDVDTSVLLVYAIDTAPEPVLYYLAEQFDVLGYKGWLMCKTVDDQRALLKRAIELHRYKGTAWAIREIVRIVGYEDATIEKRPAVRYRDGSFNHDRSQYRAPHSRPWRAFRVYIELSDGNTLDAAAADLIRGGVLAYKNARSALQRLAFRVKPTDEIPIEEVTTTRINRAMRGDAVLGRYRRDGGFYRDGTARRDSKAEEAQITIRYRTLRNGLRNHDGTTLRGATITGAM